MFTKHFFKMLIGFSFMIFLGLVGIFLVVHFDNENIEEKQANISVDIAK